MFGKVRCSIQVSNFKQLGIFGVEITAFSKGDYIAGGNASTRGHTSEENTLRWVGC